MPNDNKFQYIFSSFKRTGNFPLDDSTTFNSLDAALDYINNSGLAYKGQILTVSGDPNPNNNGIYFIREDSGNQSISSNLTIALVTGEKPIIELTDSVEEDNSRPITSQGVWGITDSRKGKRNRKSSWYWKTFLSFNI